MELKNRDIYTARPALQELLKYKFPVKVSWKVAKLVQKLNEHLEPINTTRDNLIKQYGEKDKQGKFGIDEKNKNWAKFTEELDVLMSQEIKVDVEKVELPEVVASTCDACHHNMDKPLEIEPWILLSLSPFIEGVGN